MPASTFLCSLTSTGSLFLFIFKFSPEDTFIDFRKRKGERQKNIGWLPHVHTLTRDRTSNPGMCPDRELNPHSVGMRDDTPTEPPDQGHQFSFLCPLHPRQKPLVSFICCTLLPPHPAKPFALHKGPFSGSVPVGILLL